MRGLVCLQTQCNYNFDCPYMFVAFDGACAFQACIELVSDLGDEQVFVFFLGTPIVSNRCSRRGLQMECALWGLAGGAL